MDEPALRSFEEILSDLEYVTWGISNIHEFEGPGAIEHLCSWQEELIHEMNAHPRNLTSSERK